MKKISRALAIAMALLIVVTTGKQAITATDFTEESPDTLVSLADMNYRDYYDANTASVLSEVSDEEVTVDLLQGSNIISTNASIPSAYKSVDYVTLPTVRNQGNYGTCWAHAALGLAEISISKQEGTVLDTSELALSYFEYNDVTDPLGLTDDDVNRLGAYYVNSELNFANVGGNLYYAMYTLANWKGGTDETKAPYENMAEALNSGLDNSIAFDDVAHLRSGYRMSMNDSDTVKRMIMEYGAVGTSYYDTNSTYNFNDEHDAYYQSSYSYSNHAVCIVGWDDNFSNTNFTYKPSGNGAWLIRNSWGDDGYSHYGYFWISYYDPSLGGDEKTAYAFDFVSCDSDEYYDNNYQYDGCYSTAYTAMAKAANVFTSQQDETLQAVGVDFGSTSTNYTVSVYKNLTSPTDPESGSLVASVSGITGLEGFYTIDLTSPVSLEKGDTFSVVVSLSSENTATIGIEATSTSYLTCYPSTGKGESFYCDQYNRWLDKLTYKTYWGSTGNWRIKAYTNNVEAESGEGDGEAEDDDDPATPSTPVTPVTPEEPADTRVSLKDCSVTLSQYSYVYDASEHEPSVTVTYGSQIIDSSEYSIEYQDNVNAGTATVTVKANSDSKVISGSTNTYFEITKAEYTISASMDDTLHASETLQISATGSGSIKYTSSNTGVATVSNTGLVTGINAGKIYITVEVRGDSNHQGASKTFTLTVLPKASSVTEAKFTDSDTVTIRLTAAAGADKYFIYRQDNGGAWSMIGSTTSTTFADTSSKNAGSTYTYKAVSYNTKAGLYTDETGSTASVTCVEGTKITSVSNASKYITIKWGKVSWASGYYLYRSQDDGPFVRVAVINGASNITYNDTRATVNGAKYTYKVAAFNGTTVSPDSETKICCRLNTPNISSAKNTAKRKLVLSYTKNTRANGYQIKLIVNGSGKTYTVKNNKTVAYTISSLTKGNTYKVFVRSYKTISGVTYYSSYSSSKSVKINK